MDFDTVAKIKYAFYRLLGVTSTDQALTELGENADDVAYLYLTRGCRAAQRWMLKQGYGGWRKRSGVLTWSGTDAADGGRNSALPDDFLRAYGKESRSPLVEADGTPWGSLVHPEDSTARGDGCYILGEKLWLTRGATPPTTLYLDYHYRHPVWAAGATIDFPMEARALIPAEAANLASKESWMPGGLEMERRIDRAAALARMEAMDVARPTKQARTLKAPRRAGNRW